jgi:phage baseplate assembly protein W
MATTQPEIYSDLAFNPILNHFGDASKVINLDSIRQAVKTIVLTPLGSRLFDPGFGCTATSYLFELIDDKTSISIQNSIKNALNTYENRIVINYVKVNVDSDNNKIDIEINYFIQELQENDTAKIVIAKL